MYQMYMQQHPADYTYDALFLFNFDIFEPFAEQKVYLKTN